MATTLDEQRLLHPTSDPEVLRTRLPSPVFRIGCGVVLLLGGLAVVVLWWLLDSRQFDGGMAGMGVAAVALALLLLLAGAEFEVDLRKGWVQRRFWFGPIANRRRVALQHCRGIGVSRTDRAIGHRSSTTGGDEVRASVFVVELLVPGWRWRPEFAVAGDYTAAMAQAQAVAERCSLSVVDQSIGGAVSVPAEQPRPPRGIRSAIESDSGVTVLRLPKVGWRWQFVVFALISLVPAGFLFEFAVDGDSDNSGYWVAVGWLSFVSVGVFAVCGLPFVRRALTSQLVRMHGEAVEVHTVGPWRTRVEVIGRDQPIAVNHGGTLGDMISPSRAAAMLGQPNCVILTRGDQRVAFAGHLDVEESRFLADYVAWLLAQGAE